MVLCKQYYSTLNLWRYEGGIAGSCPSATVAHTDANFGGGSFIVQAGMGETEAAAASYLLPDAAFPLHLDMTEMIFATSNAAVQIPTQFPLDLNGDQLVNGPDLAIFLSAWGKTSGPADINLDGIVNGNDLAALLSNWTG